MKRWKFWVGLVVVVVAGLIVNNSSSLTAPPAARPSLLAHRGLAQTFDARGVTGETCTATRMLPPAHDHLENTIASMRAAFELGAEAVEFDVHPTTDGQFAVFHDWTLDCRTDGRGVTREQSLAYLKSLDIGHGYTADGGKTFPFRGRGVGLMPSLDEVLAAFPDRTLLINVKSNDANEGALLAAVLARLPPDRLDRLMAYGGNAPIAELKRRLPRLRAMSRASLTSCVLRYAAIGWSGYVPQACRNTLLLVPVNVGPWLWGWPHLLQARMAGVSTPVFAIGPYGGGAFSSGIDSRDDLARLPTGYAGGIMTDRIDVMSKLVGR